MTEPVREEPLRIDASMLAPPERAAAAPRRRDFERGMSALPRLTLVLILANVLSFIHQVQAHGLKTEEAVIASGALARNAVVIDGEIWRVWTAAFLHGSFAHLFGNMVVLYIVGMALEHAVGLFATLRVYALAATLASISSLLTNDGPSLGASGAIFGLVGALLVVLHRHKSVLALRDGRVLGVLGAWSGWMLLTGFLSAQTDNAAHLGGLVTGALIGTTLKLRLDLPREPVEGRLRLR